MKPFIEDMYDEYDTRQFEFLTRKINRTPKVWTMKELYDLCIRTESRSYDRRVDRRKCLEEIIKKIEPVELYNQTHRIVYTNYRNKEGDDKLYRTEIGYNEEFQCNTISRNGWLGDKSDLMKDREEKTDFFLHPEKLELGNKYSKLSHLSDGLFRGIVFKHIWNIVEKRLKLKYTTYSTPSVIKIDICGDQYYVSSDTSNMPHISFKLLGSVSDYCMEFK